VGPDLSYGKPERKCINLRFCLGFVLFSNTTRSDLLCSLHRIPGTIHESLLELFSTFKHLRGILRTFRVPTRIFGAAAGDSKAKFSRKDPVVRSQKVKPDKTTCCPFRTIEIRK